MGEGPGADEAETGRPFIGPAGKQLEEELYAVGLPRARLFLVNAMACRPVPGKTEGQMRKATKCCRPALLAQLREHPPDTPVLAMGKWAAFALTGQDKGVMDTRGFIHEQFIIPQEEVKDDVTEGRRGAEGAEDDGEET